LILDSFVERFDFRKDACLKACRRKAGMEITLRKSIGLNRSFWPTGPIPDGNRGSVVFTPENSHKLFVRTIGISRARVKIGLANIAYNMLRYVWLTGKPQTGWTRRWPEGRNAAADEAIITKNERPSARIHLRTASS
jgi:hypothetical protein